MPADKPPAGTTPALDLVQASDLVQAIELCQQMLEAARAADWDRLVALEAERAPLLSRALSSDLPTVTRPAEVKAQIATCLRLNDEIAALTSAHITRLAEVLQGMSQPPAGAAPPPTR